MISDERGKELDLCSDSMGPGGEELGDTCRVETSLRQTKSSPKSCPPSSYNHSIKLMIHDWILSGDLWTITDRQEVL